MISMIMLISLVLLRSQRALALSLVEGLTQTCGYNILEAREHDT